MATERDNSPGYETSDAHARPIMIVGISIAALVLSALLMGLAIWHWLDTRERASQSAPSPLSERTLPARPRLQITTATDLDAWRREERVLVESYDWVDPALGRVRMPIERAMQHAVQNGLPDFTPLPTAAEARPEGP